MVAAATTAKSARLLPAILWWPLVFDRPTTDSAEYFANRLRLLQDVFVHGGVALTDRLNAPPHRLEAALSKWPVDQHRALELVRQLAKHHRWRMVPGSPGPDPDGCQWAATVVAHADGVVVLDSCACGHDCMRETPGTPVSKYGEAPWLQNLTDPVVTISKEWGSGELEALWSPVLRDARSVTIVDRYIGRVAHKKNDALRFRRALTWVVRLWHEQNATRPRTLHLVTGQWLPVAEGQTRPAPNSMQVQQHLVGVRHDLAAWPWLSLDIDLRGELKGDLSSQLPHNRYLHTDQGTWELGQGVDAFDTQGGVTPSTVTRQTVRRWDKVWRDCEALPQVLLASVWERPDGRPEEGF